MNISRYGHQVTLVATLLGLAACGGGGSQLQVDDINKLTKLSQVMEAQANLADPQFKKRDQQTFTDAEFATFADVGTRLQATALKAKTFSKGEGFDALATGVHDRAAELVTAAQAKDAAAARKALTEMKATCKECHKKYR